jgi:CheY-like chemotaxis protein
MKILIVDDDVELVKAVESTLSSVGHEVQSTNEPREGLKLIREQSHDLVFLDLSMPEFSGIDIINNLAEENTIKEKKIVVMTASAINEEEIKAFGGFGGSFYLTKTCRH